MLWNDNEFVKLYEELKNIVDEELRPYYGVDKIKWYSVYIWTKESYPGTYDGENVFDIMKDEVVFYVKDHVIPEEVKPIIKKIQMKLQELDRYIERNK